MRPPIFRGPQHARPSMVADITIFDPETVRDNSTYKVGEQGLPTTGIPYVLVSGEGGLVYPVESAITEGVWYCTLPSGSVAARRVS